MTWRPLPQRAGTAPPERLTSDLDRVARTLGAPGAKALSVVFGDWSAVVGHDAAAWSRPLWLRSGTLVVAVDDPACATALRYRAREVLDRVAEAAGGTVAERLEVRVRPRR